MMTFEYHTKKEMITSEVYALFVIAIMNLIASSFHTSEPLESAAHALIACATGITSCIVAAIKLYKYGE